MSENNQKPNETSQSKTSNDGLAGETRRKMTILFIAVGLVFVGVVISYFAFQDAGKVIDVETGEKEVADKTNDPQCHAYISTVTNIGREFKASDTEFSEKVLADDVETVKAAKAEVEQLRARLEKSKTGVSESNFRFEESEEQLTAWYKAITTELSLVDLLLDERIDQLSPKDDGGETIVAGEKKKWKSKKTPEERRDGAVLALNEAFQSFRVWHSGGMHPCGAAAVGETPWTPEKP